MFNLLGHAAHQVLACLAELTQHEVAYVIEQIGLTLFEGPSLKAALDIDWGDAEQKQQALQRLCDELESLQTWIGEQVPVELTQPPLAAAVETLHTLMAQDLEPDPTGGGARIRAGVAKDRQTSTGLTQSICFWRITTTICCSLVLLPHGNLVAVRKSCSIDDQERRHGRKSSAKRFDGYKRHLARDLDEQLILAAETLPANTPDTAGLDPLLVAVEWQHREVTSLYIDRGYLGGELIQVYDQAGVGIMCKPWPVRNPAGHFSKLDFQIDLMALQATCPAGQVIPITPGKTARFPAITYQGCLQRAQCTPRESGGRTLTIHPQVWRSSGQRRSKPRPSCRC